MCWFLGRGVWTCSVRIVSIFSSLIRSQKLIQTDNLFCEANYYSPIAYLLDSSSSVLTSPALGLCAREGYVSNHALLKSWTTSTIPNDLRKASTLLGPATAGSMTFCTHSSANFAHDGLVFIVGAGPDVGVTCPSRVLVRSWVLVSPLTVPSCPGF